MEDIRVNVVNLDQFFRFLKGHYHGNQFLGKIGEMTFIEHCGI